NKQPRTDDPPVIQPTAQHHRSARPFDQHCSSAHDQFGAPSSCPASITDLAGYTAPFHSPVSQVSLLHKAIKGSRML
ncbi:hypothetical protein U1Q18_009941, partial [Sarracenia purpurea var. burkii]